VVAGEQRAAEPRPLVVASRPREQVDELVGAQVLGGLAAGDGNGGVAVRGVLGQRIGADALAVTVGSLERHRSRPGMMAGVAASRARWVGRVVATVVPGAVGVAAPLVLREQAKRARREISGLFAGQAWPAASRGLSLGMEPRPVRLVVLGDSSGVGLGAERPEDTAGLVLLQRLQGAGLAASLDVIAVSGADARDLADQVSEALARGVDVALISVGANDVTHRLPARVGGRLLGHAVLRLRDSDAEVVVATCPDLGAVRRLGRPLRWWAAVASRREWWAQGRAARRAGARVVSVGARLGREFSRNPSHFSRDGFHPSSAGYAALAQELWPAVLAAVSGSVAVNTRAPGAASS